jgi:predicted transcriptional regulator of viral defense system
MENINELFRNNVTISYNKLLASGYTKYQIKKMCDQNILMKVNRGLYGLSNILEDEFQIHQINNQYMIYSNETTLYLHNLCDCYPSKMSVTTKSGYHLRNDDLKVYYVKESLLFVGVEIIKTPQGNDVYVYDKERTICDIIKNKNRIDQQVYIQGLQNYFLNGHPNMIKLSKYAKALNIQRKVMDIISLYMKP